jgi:hypothetical protein
MESVISSYQRKLLHVMFGGHENTRDKFNAIISSDITPHMAAIKYMDKEDYENELKQVIGDTQSAHDLGNNGTMHALKSSVVYRGGRSSADAGLFSVVCAYATMYRAIHRRGARCVADR